MDIRVLQYFLAVAREQSITKAAQALHMTQPPLSRQLKELEEELGKQLLIRTSKKIILTEDGMLLRKRAEELIDLFEKMQAELKTPDANLSGEVYIGSGETQAISFLAKTAESLHKQGHTIRYRIYSGDAEHVTQRLDQGRIDFGLLIEPVDIEKYNTIRLPVKDTWGVLMRKDAPLADKASICAEDLWDKPLIVSHQLFTSSELSGWFRTDPSKLQIVATYELIYNASHFVSRGLGYAISLDHLINTTGESNLCFRPLFPLQEAGLCIVWKKHQMFSRASALFVRQLQMELQLDPMA